MDPVSLSRIVNAEIIYSDLHLLPSYTKAHGTLMGLAFVIFFPMGAFLIRASHSKVILWIHIVCQMTGWILMVAGLVIGIRIGKILDIVSQLYR